jgi:phenylpropionate dioxygenase-like ring-hydroxylating dioxygenase large terminal subunit
MRRFWQPVCYSDELKDLPLGVRILGEDLVAFRDGSGAVGLLELHCPHRGTSLELGLVGAKGIRCCYHGWLFDVDGAILETPGEPAISTLKDRLCHGAYPVNESAGGWPKATLRRHRYLLPRNSDRAEMGRGGVKKRRIDGQRSIPFPLQP